MAKAELTAGKHRVTNPRTGADTFLVDSGTLIASDPAYHKGIWCQHEIKPAKNGRWKAYVKVKDKNEWGLRAASLHAFHEDSRPDDSCRVEPLTNCAVDTGQFVICDGAAYDNNSQFTAEAYDTPKEIFGSAFMDYFYAYCCELTEGGSLFGLIPKGVCSASGIGDGSYKGKVYYNEEGEAIGVEMFFLP